MSPPKFNFSLPAVASVFLLSDAITQQPDPQSPGREDAVPELLPGDQYDPRALPGESISGLQLICRAVGIPQT